MRAKAKMWARDEDMKNEPKSLKLVKEACMQCLFARRYREVKVDMKKMHNNHTRKEEEEKSEGENLYTFSSMNTFSLSSLLFRVSHRFRNILGLQLKIKEYFRFCFKNRSFLGFIIYSPNNSEIKLSNVGKKNFDDGERKGDNNPDWGNNPYTFPLHGKERCKQSFTGALFRIVKIVRR